MQVHLGAAAVFLLVVFLIMPAGYLGPLSARVRGLFVQHTRTGNPLVDSVAEHQVYVCLVCLPCMSALYVCRICLPYMSAVYVCRICRPYMSA